MSDVDTLKSYLISLGFKTDIASYNKAKEVVDNLASRVKFSATEMTTNYVKAGVAVVSALNGITVSVASLLDQVAQADLGYQKFALQMYMTDEKAKRLKVTTDALGESLNDIAWNKELHGRFDTLIAQTHKMDLPKDNEAQMRYLRDVRFEFTRLKIEATYASQWIGYYLSKYLNVPISDLHGLLRKVNDWIVAKMPEWTAVVAKWLSMIVQLTGSAWRGVKDLAGGVKYLWDQFSGAGKAIVIFAGLVGAFLLAGPIGQAMIVISGLILLLDDFYAYVDGRKSVTQLAPIWQTLIEWGGKLKIVLEDLSDEFMAYSDTLRDSGIAEGFKKIASAAGDTLEAITKLFNMDVGDLFSSPFIKALDIAVKLMGSLAVSSQRVGASDDYWAERRKAEKAGHPWDAARRRVEWDKRGTPGQIKGLSWLDEMKEIWDPKNPVFGVLGPGQMVEQYDKSLKKYKEKRAASRGEEKREIEGDDLRRKRSLSGIAGQESGGEKDPYGAEGPMNSRGRGTAKGKYQIMDRNWPQWAEEAGLSRNADKKDPKNQELVAEHRHGMYWKKYKGDEQLVSAAWASEEAANRLQKGDESVLKWRMGGNLTQTVGEYIKATTGSPYHKDKSPYKLPGLVPDEFNDALKKEKGPQPDSFYQDMLQSSKVPSTTNYGPTVNNNEFKMGDVIVPVTSPGASAEEISKVVTQAIKDRAKEIAMSVSRENREFAGVYA